MHGPMYIKFRANDSEDRTLRLGFDLLRFRTPFFVWHYEPTTTFRKMNLFPPSVEQMRTHLPLWVRQK